MNKYIIVMVSALMPWLAFAQEKVEGMVMEVSEGNEHLGLSGANVYWMDSQIGTMTNGDGLFSIPYKKEYNKLIISYVGYESDTLTVNSPKTIHHTLKALNALDEVVVHKKRDAIQKTFYSAQNVVTVNSAELLKAACCNLSESFETNPAIDVNFSDALTGTKQIQMLGLTSPYLLITQENIPMVRGASQAFGLTFTPGTWVESIQITKGAGSVVNGYESISGQINTELVKPLTDNGIFVNGYGNQNGRYELNTHFNKKLTDTWSSGLYIHANRRDEKEDNNGDGFLDAPLANQINVMNRWQYQNPETGWVSFINVRFLKDEKQVGQTDFDPFTDKFTTNAWGGEVDTRRFDSSVKLGYVFPELPYQSLGIQGSYSMHKQDSYYGFNQYNIDHESIYSNFIFNSIIGDTQNKFKTGFTFAYDGYNELVNVDNYVRHDNSVGAFFEYSYDNLDKVSLTAGLRVDNHNRLGTFVTPRFHIRYTPWELGSLRGSFGRGRRAANIFAENQQIFASSRQINLIGANGGGIYGFEPEDAWNYGVSFLQGFLLFERKGNVTVDYYRTDFKNQIVVDYENPNEVAFYNLDGKSEANSFQLEVNYEVVKNLDFRTAYKYYDVQTDFRTGRLQKPLQAKHRFFANLGYETTARKNGSQWRFDYTLHTLGEQRLPSTESNPEQYRLGDYSKPYSLMNAQITKVFNSNFEVYIGGENLSNYTQDNPVLGADDPFGPNFDTSIVYAPIMGRMFYGGFRFKL
ncbi:TonB-dependent receptor [Maribacter polysiphoniae]|uniref:Outer membrane receptor for ferrienterochelin and colicin n=1 Tax=Maribacter polysiphoniae TaxID=429344 RepID=A0A316ESA3_9FLAO|nr:TonB-dependent receptor [Maribacter polysiphoniae]MBD1262311.1 TonB-dependent receptor [Maribacter polysiphoniae]PWK26010.1 outer membrane receptor for ferrienterochelin and colicin [Maribacter polysiphoniae]